MQQGTKQSTRGLLMKTLGVVKWFNDAKGYGFIDTENDKDIFLHYSALLVDGFKTIAEGDKVSFELIQGVKGAQAFNVEKVES